MNIKNVPFISGDRLNSRLDEVFNVAVDSRFSDQWFLDVTKVLMRPRDGSEKIGVLPSGNVGSPGDIMWFDDDQGNKYGLSAKGWEVYKTPYQTPGKYLGTYEDLAAASASVTGSDNDYFIAHETLYIFSGWVSVPQVFLWTDIFDNEADLTEEFPTPEDNLFAFLRDTESVYFSADDVWKPIAEYYTFTAITLGNDADFPALFNPVTLPTGFQIGDTTGADATAVEKLRVSGSLEASAATYVGSYALITSGTYAGKYGFIFDYTTSSKEFTIVSIWNAVPIKSWVTYQIFTKKGKYVQITNGKDADKYYDGTNFNTYVEGMVRTNISKFVDFPSGGPGIVRTFGNQCYTSVGDSVYISDVSQPLWYNINDSIDLQKSAGVDDFFIWKNKMISFGSSFTTFINPNVAAGENRTTDFKNYGIVPGSCAEVLDDFWLLTYGWQLIPLSVTVYGDVIEKKNIGLPVYRYLREMRTNVTACFDGRKYYIYGESENAEGYTCVYDTLYSFWSVWTGIRPKKFIVDNGTVYYNEYGTGTLYKLSRNKVTDVAIPVDQYVSSKDIDGWYVLLLKTMQSIATYCENKNQEFDITLSWRTQGDSFSKRHPVKLNEKRIDDPLKVAGFNNVNVASLVPLFHYIPLDNDFANIWRWEIRNTGTNGFYLNQLQLEVWFSDDNLDNIDL